jgi:hypothetical protein
MEIVQEIGSYAGFAAVLGLAILSALYFSQARDVKRLREWAGRAPERAPTVPEPRSVTAQPIARPPSRPVPGGTPPPVPRPPGAQPAAPGAAAASAAGAAPAVARGPAPATPAAGAASAGEAADDGQRDDNGEIDVTAMDTVVHPPPPPPDDEPGAQDEAADDEPYGAIAREDDEHDDGSQDDAAEDDLLDDEDSTDLGDTGEYDALSADEETAIERPGDTGEAAAAEEPDDDFGDTGEWHPEDEHSDIGFTDEHDVAPATPAASAPRPPVPPRPYQRRGAPAPATGYARDRGAILPPYAETRQPGDDEASASDGGRRRPILLVIGAMVAIVVIAFAVLQLTGGDDDPAGGDEAGLSASDTDGGASGDDGDGRGGAPIDPSDVTVAVLNGTTVPGLAATVGDQIAGEGFQLGTVTNNFDQERAESVVLYAPGAEREAADVGRRLDIAQRETIDAESQALAGDATVVVVAGADQNQ